jgi:hypothetical protein
MEKIPTAIQEFLNAIQTGNWQRMRAYYSDHVLYDGSIPGWHYQYQGRERVLEEMRQEWTGKHTWRVVEQHLTPTTDGIVLDFEIRGRCPGDDEHESHEDTCRIANIFTVKCGRITEHRYYCCGEWDEATMRKIETEAPKVARASKVA